MFKMFLKLLIFILGCSVITIADGASIVFDSPLSQVQYVFNASRVHLTWRYRISGIPNLPTIRLNAGNNEDVVTIIGARTIYSDSHYENRFKAWRNMSFASVIIKNLIPSDYTDYKLRIEDTSLPKEVTSVKRLQAGERPTKPSITCTGAQGGISNLTVREGDDLECECSSEGLPSPNVIWEFSGGKSDDSVLKKEKISRNGSNIYTCIASNQYGLYNRSVLHLHVQYSPSIVKVISSDKSSYIGQEVTFTCSANGDPLPVYSWKTPDNHTSTGHTLVVKLQSSRQFGVYSCITNNVHGNSSRNITLRQLFVPGKPHFVSNTSKTFEITTTWRTPDNNGGSSIKRYFIRISYGTQVIAESVIKKLQYTKSDLERNRTYTFCVWAENVVGNGSKICVDRSTLYEGPPDTPEKPTLRLVDGVLEVTWNKVTGSPDFYLVEYKRRNEKHWTLSSDEITQLKYQILNIEPGETYNVRILAENKYDVKTGKFADIYIPIIKTRTTDILMTSTTPRQITSSTDKPALGQSSDDGVPSSVIIISVLLVVLVIVAVVFLVLWLKRRSAGNNRNQPEVGHLAGPLGDMYAVVEGKTKKEKNDRKDLVYAELSDFDPKANNSKPPATHHTEYADISHILTAERDNDYEDIPPRSDEGDYATIREVSRSNSIAI